MITEFRRHHASDHHLASTATVAQIKPFAFKLIFRLSFRLNNGQRHAVKRLLIGFE
jgi:hypothetical protein